MFVTQSLRVKWILVDHSVALSPSFTVVLLAHVGACPVIYALGHYGTQRVRRDADGGLTGALTAAVIIQEILHAHSKIFHLALNM